MMLSRLACILIRVMYVPQVAAAQPAVTARHGKRLGERPRVDSVVVVCGERPAFTAIELSILEILMRRSPGVADRRSIARHVWDYEADAFGSNTIDVHLARLRSKLAGAGVRIETVRGVGYRIVAS